MIYVRVSFAMNRKMGNSIDSTTAATYSKYAAQLIRTGIDHDSETISKSFKLTMGNFTWMQYL